MASRQPKGNPERPIAKPKPMSSRLLTMNFMQRNASAPGSKSHAEVQKAIEVENAKREAALLATRERSEASTREDAETRWELSFVKKAPEIPVRVVAIGYGELVGVSHSDGEEKEEGGEGTGGRMTFGKFGVKEKVAEDTPEKRDSDSSDDSDSSEDSDIDPAASKKKNKQSKSKAQAKKRDQDYIPKHLSSISNSGPPSNSSVGGRGGGGARGDRKCFQCGDPSHVRAACPALDTRKRQKNNDGNPNKRGRWSK